MAGDIFFTDTRVWSSSSAGFADIMTRAVGKCRADDTRLAEALSDAEDLRCLSINLRGDRDLQAALTERVLEAASEKLQELRASPGTHPSDIRMIEELVALAQAHLGEVRGRPGLTK